MTTRRQSLRFLATAAIGVAAMRSVVSAAQKPSRIARIGVLMQGEHSTYFQEGLRRSLRELGYVEDQNIHFEWRAAQGRPDTARALASELVRLNVDVIVANQTGAAEAARDITRTVPIVMAPSADPIAAGLIASLSRPGGNITGVTGSSTELSGKRLELLQAIVPTLTRVGLLVRDATSPGSRALADENHRAGQKLGLQIHVVESPTRADAEAAFQALANAQVGAVVVQAIVATPGWRVPELAVRHRLPTISFNREFPVRGGLLSYGIHRADVHQRAALYVHRILKGAKPADLPVELPTRFELVINQSTAKALGLTLPASLLLQADEMVG